MFAELRKALLWLLMLVLPLQGIAALSMMPLHALERGAPQMRENSATSAAACARVGSMAPQAANECDRMMAGCDHSHAGGVLKCGLSAACGLVAAPALQMPSFLQPGSSRAPVRMQTRLKVAFCTGAPERPPRLLA